MTYRNYADNVIMMVIIGNIIIMCLHYDDQPAHWENNLILCNEICGYIFLLECIVKIGGMGMYPYLY